MSKEKPTLLTIDAGTTESGYTIMKEPEGNTMELSYFGKVDNNKIMSIIKEGNYDILVYEQFQCFGMAVGESTIEAIIWNGRFIQAALDLGKPVRKVFRKDEKLCLCKSLRAKDANIRQALIDRYAKTDRKNGKGTKKEPDVFYGVSKDVWSAIAVGVTWAEMEEEEKEKRGVEKSTT